MVLLLQKFSRSKPEHHHHHHHNSEALAASLNEFRSRISIFLTRILRPENGSKSLSLERFTRCLELVSIANEAFAKLVVKTDHPMNRWSLRATREYLSFSLPLLNLLNSVTSSLSHLNHAKILILHETSVIEKSPASADKHLMAIQRKDHWKNFKVGGPTEIEEITTARPCSKKEAVILEGLTVLKRNGFLALGFVVSGLCGESKPFLEIRKAAGGVNESLTKSLDSSFCEEIVGVQGDVEEVKEVNCAAERLFEALRDMRCDKAVNELKSRLEVLETSLHGIEKHADNLFHEVLAARNKLLENVLSIADLG